jgi:hypothetical protein
LGDPDIASKLPVPPFPAIGKRQAIARNQPCKAEFDGSSIPTILGATCMYVSPACVQGAGMVWSYNLAIIACGRGAFAAEAVHGRGGGGGAYA